MKYLLFNTNHIKIKNIVKSLDINITQINEKDVFLIFKDLNNTLISLVFFFSFSIHLFLFFSFKSKLPFYSFSLLFYFLLYFKHLLDRQSLSNTVLFIRKFYKLVILLDDFMRKKSKTGISSSKDEVILVSLIKKDMIDFVNTHTNQYYSMENSGLKGFLDVKSVFMLSFNQFLEEKEGDFIEKVKTLGNSQLINNLTRNILNLTRETSFSSEKDVKVLSNSKEISLRKDLIDRMRSIESIYNKVLLSIEAFGEGKEEIYNLHSQILKFSLFLKNKFSLDEAFLDLTVVSKESKKERKDSTLSTNKESIAEVVDRRKMIEELEEVNLSCCLKKEEVRKEGGSKERQFNNMNLSGIESEMNSSKARFDFFSDLTENFKGKIKEEEVVEY